jgi:hypothetical protein
MGRAVVFVAKSERFQWPGKMIVEELKRLLAEVRVDALRRERDPSCGPLHSSSGSSPSPSPPSCISPPTPATTGRNARATFRRYCPGCTGYCDCPKETPSSCVAYEERALRFLNEWLRGTPTDTPFEKCAESDELAKLLADVRRETIEACATACEALPANASGYSRELAASMAERIRAGQFTRSTEGGK